MVSKRHKGRGPAEVSVLIFLIIAFLAGGYIHASNGEGGSGLGRYRVFSLKFIPAGTGKEYLAKAGIGTVSQLPGANTLLVTASQEELLKATAILRLVDSDAQFVLETIQTAWDVNNLPLEQIKAELDGIEVGTFINPPLRSSKPRAIIDIHDGRVMVVAPVERFEEIISIIERKQQATSGVAERPDPEEYIEPNQTRGPALEARARAELEMAEAELEKMAASDRFAKEEDLESDELFNRLLGSLAEAEKSAAEKAPEAAKRDHVQPETVAPGPQLPSQRQVIKQKVRRPSDVAEVAAEKARRIQQVEPRPEEAKAMPDKPQEVVQERVETWSYEPQIDLKGDEMLDLDLPERLEISDLLGLVGEYLNLDYMYDPEKIKGSVTLKLRGPIKVRDLYPLLESVLKFQGFVMTRKGNLVTIVPAAEAMSIDPVLQIADGRVELGNVIITRVFELEYLDTASATNLLKGMQLGADITPISETGNLIVTDYAYRMERIEEVLGIVDKPGRPKQFRFRQLKYTMASTLAPKIKSLAEQLGTVSITIGAATPAKPAPARTTRRTPAPRPAPRPKPTPAAAEKPTVYLDADERTNRILMIGLEDQLVIVDDLISALDVEQQDLRALRLYDIQYVGAEEVRDKLIELGIIGATTTRRGQSPYLSRDRRSTAAQARTPGAAQQAARTPSPPSASRAVDEEPLTEEPQVVIVESTNSLLVNATAEQHTQIAMIISYVDTETIAQAVPYEIYQLENQKPEDLAEVLNKLIQETIRDKEGKIEQTIKKIDEDIVIVPDASTFSLIVYANKKNQEWISRLIKTLDKRRPQVLIDVSMVEINREDLFEYDLNIITNARNVVAGNIGVAGKILPIEDAAGDLEFGWNLVDVDSGKTTGQLKGFYSSDKIQAVLTAMQKHNYGRLLAQPKVLVNDNEQGIISTSETTYVTETTTTVIPGSDTPQQSVKFTPYDAKVELKITPTISEGDLLRLEIEMLSEDFVPQDDVPPDYRRSNLTTVVTVPNGSTIILGGLSKLKQTKGGSKVPILGDIPIVGNLFRTVSDSDKTNKLYLFVKADILRPDDTLGLGGFEEIAARNRREFEREEELFQQKEGLAGIRPEPMDPLRILEVE